MAQLRTLPAVSWGLFEDSPEKLRQDLEAARQNKDKEESVKLLAEARQLMQLGRYDEAQRAAYRAQQLHGGYSAWDFGDRPDKVLADIETDRLKHKGAPMQPPAPAVAVNPKPDDKHATAPPAPKGNDVAVAVNNSAYAPHPAQPTPPAQPVAPPPPVPAPLVGPAADPNRARADQLLAEVGRLERKNELLEARKKAMEAVQLHATFGPNEESPDYALSQCAFLAHREINRLMVHATDSINCGDGDPLQRCTLAEHDLLQARELANGFGQDAQPVEAKLTWVRQRRAVVLKQPVPKPAAPAVAAPTGPAPTSPVVQGPPSAGAAKLDMARRELSRGSTTTARNIAEEVSPGRTTCTRRPRA